MSDDRYDRGANGRRQPSGNGTDAGMRETDWKDVVSVASDASSDLLRRHLPVSPSGIVAGPPAGDTAPEAVRDGSGGFRRMLSDDGDDGGRGILGDQGSLGHGDVAERAREAAAKGDRDRRRRLARLFIPLAVHLLPILAVVIGLLLLAQCVSSMNPFGGGGSGDVGTMSAMSATGASGAGGTFGATGAIGTAGTSGTGEVTRQRGNQRSLPAVYIDPSLADMFADDEDSEDEDGTGNPCLDYPYVATFFGSDDDWTDTLYGSDDCIDFHAIGKVPNEMRDPSIMLYKGRYWVITCRNDEDGHVWFNISSSENLQDWTEATLNGPFSLDRLPYCNGYGTSSNYDVVAPEWFLDEDDSVHVIFSCGHWGACHGSNWDDWMEAYMLDVDKLTCKSGSNVLTPKGQARWMDVNANYDDRIDGTIDLVDGTYYLTIKRHGLNMELWKNTKCSPSGWVRLKDCFLYGYEAPCLFEDESGTWHIFGDGCPDVRPFGTKTWASDSIEGDWTPAPLHFFREDGSELELVRHGTVLPVEGAGSDSVSAIMEPRDGNLTEKQKAVIRACRSTGSPGAGLCALWVGDVYANANVGVSFRGHAYEWYYECCKPGATHNWNTVKTDPHHRTLKPGMVIAVPSSSSGTEAGRTYGHIGIYVGDGKVMHNIGTISTCSVDEWIDTYGKYAPVGWGWPPGMP